MEYTILMQYKEGIKTWLLKRTISEEILQKFTINYDDRITIPIHDESGNFIFNKYRRNPLLSKTGPKYWYDKGAQAYLYGAQFITDKEKVVITEGELDALVLWSHNISAVSSTGGCMTFKEEWVKLLENKEVYICYDNDRAGCTGAVRTLTMIPHAKVILLPNTGNIKDITDYYALTGDLRNLMESAKHYVSIEEVDRDMKARRGSWQSTLFHEIWIQWWESEHINQEEIKKPRESKEQDTQIQIARATPIDSIVVVNRQNNMVCLWHVDSSPSMHVYEDNHAYCFSCSKRADVIDVVREKLNMGFVEAVKYLNTL